MTSQGSWLESLISIFNSVCMKCTFVLFNTHTVVRFPIGPSNPYDFTIWNNCKCHLDFFLQLSVFLSSSLHLFLVYATFNSCYGKSFFGGLQCVGNSFAHVTHFLFLRDVWESCRNKQARYTNLATHLPVKGTQAWEFFGLWFWNLYFFVVSYA